MGEGDRGEDTSFIFRSTMLRNLALYSRVNIVLIGSASIVGYVKCCEANHMRIDAVMVKLMRQSNQYDMLAQKMWMTV